MDGKMTASLAKDEVRRSKLVMQCWYLRRLFVCWFIYVFDLLAEQMLVSRLFRKLCFPFATLFDRTKRCIFYFRDVWLIGKSNSGKTFIFSILSKRKLWHCHVCTVECKRQETCWSSKHLQHHMDLKASPNSEASCKSRKLARGIWSPQMGQMDQMVPQNTHGDFVMLGFWPQDIRAYMSCMSWLREATVRACTLTAKDWLKECAKSEDNKGISFRVFNLCSCAVMFSGFQQLCLCQMEMVPST